MKVFIGQRVSGENVENLKNEMFEIKKVLESKKIKSYSTLDEELSFDKAGDWINHAFEKIKEFDTYLAIVRSEEKSEGLLMEIGNILSKGKKFILLINKNVKNTYLRDLADDVIEFKDKNDMLTKLNKISL